MDEISDDHLRRFREHVADVDVDCPGCGYNLRGLTWPVCPECKQDLELRVGLMEPKLGAFIFGLVALAGGVGFHAMLLGYLCWLVAIRSRTGFPSEATVVVIVAIAMFTALMFLWISQRRRLRRLRIGPRWTLGVVAWALFVASAIAFFATVG